MQLALRVMYRYAFWPSDELQIEIKVEMGEMASQHGYWNEFMATVLVVLGGTGTGTGTGTLGLIEIMMRWRSQEASLPTTMHQRCTMHTTTGRDSTTTQHSHQSPLLTINAAHRTLLPGALWKNIPRHTSSQRIPISTNISLLHRQNVSSVASSHRRTAALPNTTLPVAQSRGPPRGQDPQVFTSLSHHSS